MLNDTKEQTLAKLKWQCRRGTQELDKLLIAYLEKHYCNAEALEQQHFQELLLMEDSQLLQLFFSDSAKQHPLNYLVEKICLSATV